MKYTIEDIPELNLMTGMYFYDKESLKSYTVCGISWERHQLPGYYSIEMRFYQNDDYDFLFNAVKMNSMHLLTAGTFELYSKQELEENFPEINL